MATGACRSGIWSLRRVRNCRRTGRHRPDRTAGLGVHRSRRDPAGTGVREPRPGLSPHRRTICLHAHRFWRLRRLLDRVGVLDRRLGRQCRDRRRLSATSGVLAEPANQRMPRRRASALAAIWLLTLSTSPACASPGSCRWSPPSSIRAAAGDRRCSACSSCTRQLHPVRRQPRQRLGHCHRLGRGPLTLWAFIGLESATVPAEEVKDPSARFRARPSSARSLTTLRVHARDGRGHGHHPERRAGRLDGAVRGRRQGRIFGAGWASKVIAARRDGLDLRRAQRLDPDPGPGPAGRRRRTACSPSCSRRSAATRKTPVAGLVVSSVLVTGLMPMNYTRAWSTPSRS